MHRFAHLLKLKAPDVVRKSLFVFRDGEGHPWGVSTT